MTETARLYHQEKSIYRVASILNLSPCGVWKRLKREGVTMYKQTEESRAKGGLKLSAMFKEGRLNNSGKRNPMFGKKQTLKQKRAVSLASSKNVGSLNSYWKGGTSRNYGRSLMVKDECSSCKSKKNLDQHHIDGNPKNNKLSNLTCLCRSCHKKVHLNA